MTDLKGEPLDHLRCEIRKISPGAGTLLDLMGDECGVETAYYAAFVVVFLEALLREKPPRRFGSYNANDFQDFTFFEKAEGDERALALFDDLLRVYQAERQNA